MKLAKGTSPYLAVPPAVLLSGIALALILREHIWLGLSISALGTVLLLFLLYFFRDPERHPGEGLVSPADGRILFVKEGPPFEVSIFMDVFNVHVNRAPLSGKVISVEHKPGGYVPAFKKESDRNERVVTKMETHLGNVVMVQIAGLLARRIVPYVRKGEKVEKGDRVGIIRLGSRVDLRVPCGMIPKVQKGDKVIAGETTIAEECR